MATLSAAQIAAYLASARCPTSARVNMVAIALAESGGRTTAFNGTCCYGLWQINKNHFAGLNWHGREWADPAQNASAAVKILVSQGYSAWETYTNGAYKHYLTKAKQGVANAGAAGTAPGEPYIPGVTPAIRDAGGTLEAAKEAVSYLDRTTNWLSDRDNIFRMIRVAAGGLLIVGSLGILAYSAVWSATPVGKLSKALRKGLK